MGKIIHIDFTKKRKRQRTVAEHHLEQRQELLFKTRKQNIVMLFKMIAVLALIFVSLMVL